MVIATADAVVAERAVLGAGRFGGLAGCAGLVGVVEGMVVGIVCEASVEVGGGDVVGVGGGAEVG